jgi:macrophage erythroblast attacher
MESVKAPFEFLSASFRRSQKQLSSEMKDIVLKLGSLQNKSQEDMEEVQKVYAEIEKRIAVLLVVLDDANVVEKDQLGKIKARCQEYQPPNNPASLLIAQRDDPSANILSVARRELVLIGEFLLRRGHLDAVGALIEESGEWLDDLLDVQRYRTAAGVETSVLKGELDTALQWVQDHASKLRRLNSALEFFVRQEQFLTLVYTGQSLEALRFAQVRLLTHSFSLFLSMSLSISLSLYVSLFFVFVSILLHL